MNQPNSNTILVKVETDVVASKSGELREKLRSLAGEGPRNVTLDFSIVRMIDSAGLGMLIAAHNSFKKSGGELAVTRCSNEILELFRSMRIHQHMRVDGGEVPAA